MISRPAKFNIPTGRVLIAFVSANFTFTAAPSLVYRCVASEIYSYGIRVPSIPLTQTMALLPPGFDVTIIGPGIVQTQNTQYSTDNAVKLAVIQVTDSTASYVAVFDTKIV